MAGLAKDSPKTRRITTLCCGSGDGTLDASTTSSTWRRRTRRQRSEPSARYAQPKRQGRSKGLCARTRRASMREEGHGPQAHILSTRSALAERRRPPADVQDPWRAIGLTNVRAASFPHRVRLRRRRYRRSGRSHRKRRLTLESSKRNELHRFVVSQALGRRTPPSPGSVEPPLGARLRALCTIPALSSVSPDPHHAPTLDQTPHSLNPNFLDRSNFWSLRMTASGASSRSGLEGRLPDMTSPPISSSIQAAVESLRCVNRRHLWSR